MSLADIHIMDITAHHGIGIAGLTTHGMVDTTVLTTMVGDHPGRGAGEAPDGVGVLRGGGATVGAHPDGDTITGDTHAHSRAMVPIGLTPLSGIMALLVDADTHLEVALPTDTQVEVAALLLQHRQLEYLQHRAPDIDSR